VRRAGRARVLDEMIAGHPLPEIRRRVKMDEFRDQRRREHLL
jgi:hypothetical protein